MRVYPVALAIAVAALALPGAVMAVGAADTVAPDGSASFKGLPFTPARVDPALAQKVASILGEDSLQFTPASKQVPDRGRTVTVAVRVDPATARAISVRDAVAQAGTADVRDRTIALEPTRYNLGIARGYQAFAQVAKPAAIPAGLRDITMPDLASFATRDGGKAEKPGRFQPRIAVGSESEAGRTPRTLQGAPAQSVDVSTSYRVKGNLNLTAGLRLSQDRNRLAPLTDGVDDDQAVYVGTQLRF